ncbi:MAG: hydrogen gas-evolving membrane-bound hydrogenase subunit E [Endomicrobiales bacterium]
MISIQLLLVFMILAALIAVEAKDMLASVIALGTVGLGLSLSFLLLKAPDLAVILLIVEVLTLSTLIKTVKKGSVTPRTGSDLFTGAAVAVFAAVFLTTGFMALKELPAFGAPLLTLSSLYQAEGLAKTGATNLVSAIAFDFRALDTLGSAAVLFLTAIGVVSIMGRPGRKGG